MHQIISTQLPARAPSAVPAPGHAAQHMGQAGAATNTQLTKRELLLSQEMLRTAAGATISVWTCDGHVKLWAHARGGMPTSVALRPWEVDALIERLRCGEEAANPQDLTRNAHDPL
jgi:hypothetical protein